MLRKNLAVGAALSALLLTGQAQASVTVIGGGMAEACSRAVKAGRADKEVFDVCTYSLDQEALRRRDRAGTLVNRGIVQFRMQALEGALRDLRRAEELQPAIGEIHVNRGAVLIMQKRPVEALASIDRGLELGVEELDKAYYNRALAKEKLDDMKGAYFDYLKASELDPTWELPRTQLTRFTVTRR